MTTATAIKADNTAAAAIDGEEVAEEITFDVVSRDYKNAKRGLERATERLTEAKDNLKEAKATVEETKAAVRKFMEAE